MERKLTRKEKEHRRAELIKKSQGISAGEIKNQVEEKLPEGVIKETIKEEIKVIEEESIGEVSHVTEGEKVGESGEKEVEKSLIDIENSTKPNTLTETEKKEQERTTVKKRLFLEYFEKTLGSIKATCAKTGISRWTFYEWLKKDHDFFEATKHVEIVAIEDAYEGLMKAILEGNVRAITYFLDRRHPDFMPKLKIDQPRVGETSLDDIISGMIFVDSVELDENGKPKETSKKDVDESGGNRAGFSNTQQERQVS